MEEIENEWTDIFMAIFNLIVVPLLFFSEYHVYLWQLRNKLMT